MTDIKGHGILLMEFSIKLKEKSFPIFFKNVENIITNLSVTTNKFSTFFTNIGQNLSRKIKMAKNKNIHNYLTQSLNHNFNFKL